MASQTTRFPQRRHTGQVSRGRNHENQIDRSALVEEINKLSYLLNMETAKFMDANAKVFHLSKDLHETKLQLEKQKSLKEMYINQGKEKKRELETVNKYADEETLSTAKIAFQVQSTIKHKKKKLLQKDYEELQVAHVMSQQKFSSEIQMEKEKNKALQEELEAVKISYQDLKSKYDTDILAARQETETLQEEIKSNMDKMAQDQELIVNLRAEVNALHQQMEQERASLQQAKDSYQELSCRYQADVTAARKEVETLQQELKKEIKAHEESGMESQKLIDNLRAELDNLHHQMEQERASLQQNSKETEMRLEVELKHIKDSCQELSCRYEADVQAARKEAERLQQELKEIKVQVEVMKDLELINNQRAEKDLEDPKTGPKELLSAICPNDHGKDDFGPTTGTEPISVTHVSEETFLEERDKLDPEPQMIVQLPEQTDPKAGKKTHSVLQRMRGFLGLKKPKESKKRKT